MARVGRVDRVPWMEDFSEITSMDGGFFSDHFEEFSADQLRQLREYIQQREQQIELKAGTLNIDELLEGLAEIRSGLSDEQFDEIERAINAEYREEHSLMLICLLQQLLSDLAVLLSVRIPILMRYL